MIISDNLVVSSTSFFARVSETVFVTFNFSDIKTLHYDQSKNCPASVGYFDETSKEHGFTPLFITENEFAKLVQTYLAYDGKTSPATYGHNGLMDKIAEILKS